MQSDSIINDIARTLGIPKAGVSKSLMFCKTSKFDTVWHIVDWEGVDDAGGLEPLHAPWPRIKPQVKADSLIQLSFIEIGEILICEGCVTEFILASEYIQRLPSKAFIEHEDRRGRIIT